MYTDTHPDIPAGINTHAHMYTHLEIGFAGPSEWHTGIQTFTAATHTPTSPVADALVQIKRHSHTLISSLMTFTGTGRLSLPAISFIAERDVTRSTHPLGVQTGLVALGTLTGGTSPSHGTRTRTHNTRATG